MPHDKNKRHIPFFVPSCGRTFAVYGSESSIVMPFKALGMVIAIFLPLNPILGF
jgi:hypothetical protein